MSDTISESVERLRSLLKRVAPMPWRLGRIHGNLLMSEGGGLIATFQGHGAKLDEANTALASELRNSIEGILEERATSKEEAEHLRGVIWALADALGDHALDKANAQRQSPNDWPAGQEGKVVRYFRHPTVGGERVCQHCGTTMHDHGWIDTREGGHIVCPGDFIITGIRGENYPCKPDIFADTYEAVPMTGSPLPGTRALTKATARALRIVADNPRLTGRCFAELMWPDSLSHQRSYRCGNRNTAARGTQLPRVGGSYLSKLTKRGLLLQERDGAPSYAPHWTISALGLTALDSLTGDSMTDSALSETAPTFDLDAALAALLNKTACYEACSKRDKVAREEYRAEANVLYDRIRGQFTAHDARISALTEENTSLLQENQRPHWHPDWSVSLNAARALVDGDPRPENLTRMYGLLCTVTAILGEFEPTPSATDPVSMSPHGASSATSGHAAADLDLQQRCDELGITVGDLAEARAAMREIESDRNRGGE